MEKDIVWVFKRAVQYFLIHLSFTIKKPLCGPILGTLVTNYNCNYRCKMCDLPFRDEILRKKGLKELPTLQLKMLLKDFADLGVSGIGFTGGEPLLRKDLFELLRYAKELGMITHLNTNGFFLDENNIKKILDAGVDSLNISLDGAKEGTHDTIRGHVGAFKKVTTAIASINRLRKERPINLRLKVVSVINENNIDEVPDLVKLSTNMETDCIEFIPEQPFYAGCSSNDSAYDGVFKNKLIKTVEYLSNVRCRGVNIENSPRHLKLFKRSFENKKIPYKCYAGYNSFAVDCYGEIYPCVPWLNWDKAVGNISEINLKDLWYSSRRYGKVRKDILECRGCYLNCQTELNLLFNLRQREIDKN